MEPILTFEVCNQHIKRTDNFRVVADSRNYLYSQFSFLTDDWDDCEKTAIFSSKAGCFHMVLENGRCQVPWECLEEEGNISVSVFAGDRITADKANVRVFESGYCEDDVLGKTPTPDVYAQIIELLAKKADGLRYEESLLSLLSGEKVLSKVTIKGGGEAGREIALRNNGRSIEWCYVGDEDWSELVPLTDITGPQGKPGVPGPQGEPGQKGTSYLETVKNQVDGVAQTNTLYCLGTIETLSIVFPENANAGEEIAVIWYNTGIPCQLTMEGNVIPVTYTPKANTRSEINALFDGTRWSVLWSENEVIL